MTNDVIHRSVLDLSPETEAGPQVLFHQEEGTKSVIMRRADFEDLGEPDKITVTIVSGDKLNEIDEENARLQGLALMGQMGETDRKWNSRG